MNLEHLEQKLMDAARSNVPSDAVPYAFEKRIIARVKELPLDSSLWWGTTLWRGALVCVGVTLLCGVWAYAPLSGRTDLSQDLEHTILASTDDSDTSSW